MAFEATGYTVLFWMVRITTNYFEKVMQKYYDSKCTILQKKLEKKNSPVRSIS